MTALGVTTGGWGWFPMAALFAVAAVAAVPLVGWADRRPRLGETATVAEPIGSDAPAATGPGADEPTRVPG
ncbi:hypothetical protein ONA91_01795 [Micromonospora sp. DR5-3]|uniref:hypothetical protein n=1 Tax=unclassified Micromonospora TaxID=2617518 RepID=UPI0011DB143B|nr:MULTISPECIES: hypothetical protein [unclassified Micromonospora]MCW3813192.1 hypothetical protein [Micromonospora sp. DR5-3]TYC25833.1 hypothetical protein FXF52_00175 [Micromonospora sp. MP36]